LPAELFTPVAERIGLSLFQLAALPLWDFGSRGNLSLRELGIGSSATTKQMLLAGLF
jgi:hypothetical protein